MELQTAAPNFFGRNGNVFVRSSTIINLMCRSFWTTLYTERRLHLCGNSRLGYHRLQAGALARQSLPSLAPIETLRSAIIRSKIWRERPATGTAAAVSAADTLQSSSTIGWLRQIEKPPERVPRSGFTRFCTVPMSSLKLDATAPARQLTIDDAGL